MTSMMVAVMCGNVHYDVTESNRWRRWGVRCVSERCE